VLNLNEYLSSVGDRMKANQIPLAEYIITKQLTRALSEYADIKGQPHVAVAQRLKNQGKSESELVNNFIPYVICKIPFVADKQNPQLADKSFHPEEVINGHGKHEVDNDWYITQQILPPITRLIEHIDGIDVEFVAQCLGVDPKKYKYHSDKKTTDAGPGDDIGPIQNAILHTETEKSLKHRSIAELKIKCPYCQESYNFPGVTQDGTGELSGLSCKACKLPLPHQYVMNRVNLFLKQLITVYYAGKTHVYDICRELPMPGAFVQCQLEAAAQQQPLRHRYLQGQDEA
jgi:DNA polymerase alpha subunit A